MKFLIAIIMLINASTLVAQEVDQTNPYKMLRTVAENTFSRITADQSLIEKDKNHLKVIVEEELLPYIDYRYASQRVLGSYISKVRNIKDKEQQQAEIKNLKRFIEVFRKYLITSYAGIFTQYRGQEVEFSPQQDFSGKKLVLVKTKIVEPGKPDIQIDFKVRKTKSGEWKGFDMLPEGISLLDAKQAEFHGILRTEGLTYVIDMLEQKSQLPVQFAGE
jgi:phospholipid transport system substrate-binding protein